MDPTAWHLIHLSCEAREGVGPAISAAQKPQHDNWPATEKGRGSRVEGGGVSQHAHETLFHRRAAGEAMEQIKTFRWEVGGEKVRRGARNSRRWNPDRHHHGYRTRSTLALGGRAWVRGPLALAARSAGHDPLPSLNPRTCHWRSSSSTRQGGVLATTPGLGAAWGPRFPGHPPLRPQHSCRRLNDSEGLFWIGTSLGRRGGVEGASQPA